MVISECECDPIDHDGNRLLCLYFDFARGFRFLPDELGLQGQAYVIHGVVYVVGFGKGLFVVFDEVV